MGNAGGKVADGFGFLGLLQLSFHSFLIGNIPKKANKATAFIDPALDAHFDVE